MAAEFFRAWATFALLVLGAAAGAALWAWRSGLFADQERARKLALWAEIPEEEIREE